jgi:hypothetical protein
MSERIERLIYAIRSMSWLADPRRLAATPDYRIDRPIFILGTQGGGLTLLSRMLRRHPQVISAAGNHRYWTSADEIQNVYGPILPAELTGLRYKVPPHPELPPAPRSWTYAVGDLFAHYRKQAHDASPELARSLRAVIRYAARRYASDPHRFRFVDKSQTYTVRVGLIHELLKDSDPQFVLVPREPYISVYRAASGKAADMRFLQRSTPLARRVELCAEHFANSMRAVFDDCDQQGIDLLTIPFEHLLAAPEATLQRVCQFVGLDFRHDMLPAGDHRLPLGTRYRDRWYPLRTDVNEPYERQIDDFVIREVNRRCGDLFERLGYRRRGEQELNGVLRDAG